MKHLKRYKQLFESISVWHGSTVKFSKFDLDKVGSGDGKNLGGWGFYFSDDKNVADRYYLKGGSVKEYSIEDGPYFDLDEMLDDNTADEIKRELENRGISEDAIEQFQTDFVDYIDYGGNTNKQVLDWLEYVMGSPKEASMFLKDLGFIGNKFEDKWERGSMNYVVFNPDSIQ